MKLIKRELTADAKGKVTRHARFEASADAVERTKRQVDNTCRRSWTIRLL